LYTVFALHQKFRRCVKRRLTAGRRCGSGSALQPRGERPDHVAPDRWLMEDRCGAEPACDEGGMTQPAGVILVSWRPRADFGV